MPWHPYIDTPEIKSPEKVERMHVAGALAREALEVGGRAVAVGATTDEVDAAVHEFVVARGAYPSPLGYMGFQKSVSTSVNDVIAHGIPDDRALEDGDILNVDVTVFIGGCHGDTSSMFIAGTPDDVGLAMCRAAREATWAGIGACGPGVDFRVVGSKIEEVADAAGLLVCPRFIGHGIGTYFHGAPSVWPFANDNDEGLMLPGMTFTIEPVLVENRDDTFHEWEDKWTCSTLTNARSAQFEHTILITEDGVEVLTGPSIDFEAVAAEQRPLRAGGRLSG